MDGDEASRDSGDAPVAQMTFPQDQSFKTALGDDDVLLGRGTGPNEFTGNIRYRRLVRQAITSVHPRDLASNKTALAQKVVDDVGQNGGRFVRKLSKGEVAALYDSLNPQSASKAQLATHMSHKGSIYIDVERDVAIEKTKQSFRHQTRVKQKPTPKQPTAPPSTRRQTERTTAQGSPLANTTIQNSASVAIPVPSSGIPFLPTATPAAYPVELMGGLLGTAHNSSVTAPNHPLSQVTLQTLLMRCLSSLPQTSPLTVNPPAVSVAGLTNNLAQLEHQWPLLNPITASLVARTSNASLAIELARQQQHQQLQEQYALAALLATTRGQLPASRSSQSSTSDLMASLIGSSARPSLPQPLDMVTLMTLLQGSSGGGEPQNLDPSNLLNQQLPQQQHQHTPSTARAATNNTNTTIDDGSTTNTTQHIKMEHGKKGPHDEPPTKSVHASSKKKGDDGLS
jgi:hypothetical protein